MKENNIETVIDNENLRTVNICVDDEFIFSHDEGIGGLYSINKSTLEIKNILTPYQIFKYGKFEVKSIFQWNEKVIIVPCELYKDWIIYSKVSKKVQYRKIIKALKKTSGIYLMGEIGFLLPVTKEDSIFIINLNTLTVIKEIMDWSRDLLKESETPFSVWPLAGLVIGSELYFNIFDTKYLLKLTEKSLKKYILDIPFGIRSMDCSNNEIWVLPADGECIYLIDKNGKVLETVFLGKDKHQFSTSDYIKIISTEKYLFLLPFHKMKICIYDKRNKNIVSMIPKNTNLKNIYPLRCNPASYWEYFIEKEKLFLMPLENKCLIINLNSLEWEVKNIFLPSYISQYGLQFWYEWSQLFVNLSLYIEVRSKALNIYCEIIECECDLFRKNKEHIGRVIWKEINGK